MRCLTLLFNSHAGCEIIPATNGRETVYELFVDWLMVYFMLLNHVIIEQVRHRDPVVHRRPVESIVSRI